MYFDTKALKDKFKQLSKDVEKCELKDPAWLWIIGGGIVGLASSCLKLKRKTGKPIIAKLNSKK